jgi:hypothetical protein
VEVVGAALGEVPLGALVGDGVGVQHTAEGGDVRGVVWVDRVGDRHEGPELLVVGRDRGQQRCVGALEDHGDHVGVVEEVVELPLDVAVVDVDRHRTDLDRGEHGDDVLDGVLGVDRHVVAGADALALQVVREPVGLGLQVGVRRDAIAHLDGGVVGGGVDRVLEQVSDVEGHDRRLEHVLVCG